MHGPERENGGAASGHEVTTDYSALLDEAKQGSSPPELDVEPEVAEGQDPAAAERTQKLDRGFDRLRAERHQRNAEELEARLAEGDLTEEQAAQLQADLAWNLTEGAAAQARAEGESERPGGPSETVQPGETSFTPEQANERDLGALAAALADKFESKWQEVQDPFAKPLERIHFAQAARVAVDAARVAVESYFNPAPIMQREKIGGVGDRWDLEKIVDQIFEVTERGRTNESEPAKRPDILTDAGRGEIVSFLTSAAESIGLKPEKFKLAEIADYSMRLVARIQRAEALVPPPGTRFDALAKALQLAEEILSTSRHH